MACGRARSDERALAEARAQGSPRIGCDGLEMNAGLVGRRHTQTGVCYHALAIAHPPGNCGGHPPARTCCASITSAAPITLPSHDHVRTAYCPALPTLQRSQRDWNLELGLSLVSAIEGPLGHPAPGQLQSVDSPIVRSRVQKWLPGLPRPSAAQSICLWSPSRKSMPRTLHPIWGTRCHGNPTLEHLNPASMWLPCTARSRLVVHDRSRSRNCCNATLRTSGCSAVGTCNKPCKQSHNQCAREFGGISQGISRPAPFFCFSYLRLRSGDVGICCGRNLFDGENGARRSAQSSLLPDFQAS